jgi:H+/Cl- antiporter ClcA
MRLTCVRKGRAVGSARRSPGQGLAVNHDDVRRRLLRNPPQLFAWREQLLGPVLTVGALGGLAGGAYLAALRLLQQVLWPEHHAPLTSLVLLTVVGLVIGLLTRWLGNPGDVELLVDNIHVIGRPESARSLRSLIPVSLLGIAVGGAAGPEAPLVQTTGTLGSTIATRAGRSPDGVRILAITGMAAGFTVLFGTPLGAAIFALEILHRRGLEYYEALMPAIIGSLTGYALSVLLGSVGLAPIFDFPPTPVLHEGHLGWAVAAGVVGGIVATVFTYLVEGLRHSFSRIGLPVRPMLGGLLLGLFGLVTPYALTFAEEQIDPLLAASLGVGTLALIAGLKLLASAVTVTSGWRGGFIIPLFFVGATLGKLGAQIWPDAGEIVLVAALMAAINAGVTKTPLGSTIVVSEMAGLLMLPTTLLATVVSLLLTSGVSVISSQRERSGSVPDAPAESDGS